MLPHDNVRRALTFDRTLPSSTSKRQMDITLPSLLILTLSTVSSCTLKSATSDQTPLHTSHVDSIRAHGAVAALGKGAHRAETTRAVVVVTPLAVAVAGRVVGPCRKLFRTKRSVPNRSRRSPPPRRCPACFCTGRTEDPQSRHRSSPHRVDQSSNATGRTRQKKERNR